VTGWLTFNPATNEGGPKLLRWNRLNDTPTQIWPIRMAVDGISGAYLNLEYSYQYYSGIETNKV
jgi:hypothetical protein